MEKIRTFVAPEYLARFGSSPSPSPFVPPPSVPPEGHAVNSITCPAPCELHIPLGIHGRTEKVARALAIPGSGLFHGTPILLNYARVQVVSIEAKHEEEQIDIPRPEGAHFLGQSVNQFILWNKNYIRNLAPSEQERPAEPSLMAIEQGTIT